MDTNVYSLNGSQRTTAVDLHRLIIKSNPCIKDRWMDTNVYSLDDSQRTTAGDVTECEWGKQSAPTFQRRLVYVTWPDRMVL